MNSHHMKTRNAPGFFLAAVAVFCVAAWMATISPALGQGVSGPLPPPGPAVQEPPAGSPAEQAPPAAVPAEQVAPPGPLSPVPEATALQAKPPQTVEVYGISCPPEYVPLVQKTVLASMSENFTFYPIKAMDPFVPFISTEAPVLVRMAEGDNDEPREAGRLFTPLQKMTVVEIERGLKAITWGALGRRAVIEDSTGKGYIVSVGTPAGERNGVITQILNDRLVIQQEIWDRKARKRMAQDLTIKLSKKTADEATGKRR